MRALIRTFFAICASFSLVGLRAPQVVSALTTPVQEDLGAQLVLEPFQCSVGKALWDPKSRVLALEELLARATSTTRRQRLSCRAVLTIPANEGKQFRWGRFVARGRVEKSSGGVSSVTLRYFVQGTTSRVVREFFSEMSDSQEFELKPKWEEEQSPCGKSLSLTILMDLTANLKEGEEPQEISLKEIEFPKFEESSCETERSSS